MSFDGQKNVSISDTAHALNVLSRPSERKPKSNFPLWVRLGFILLMVALIAFAIYQCASHITVGMNTLRTQEITDNAYVSLDLYIFREETVISSDARGALLLYSVSDGEKVGVNDRLGEIYSSPDMSDGQRKETQSLLNAYYAKLQILRANGTQTLADLQSTLSAIDKSYVEMLSAASEGRLDIAGGFSKEMLEQIDRYISLTGGSGSAVADADAINQARMSLLSSSSLYGELTTDTSGYFYYGVDGYEDIFDYGSVMTMTADDFLLMTEKAPDTHASIASLCGKLVTSPVWYAAAYVSHEDAKLFEVGREYTMQVSDSAWSEIGMTLERNDQSKDGALLVFSSYTLPSDFSFGRKISVRTVSESIHGYRVPSSALVTLTASDGSERQGVYVLEGNVVEFRLIDVIAEYNGYCIVKSIGDISEDEKAEAEWYYLSLNDKIITSGSGLSEGKIIS